MRILCGKFQRPNLKFAIIHFVITSRSYSCNRLCRIHHSRRRRGCEVSHYECSSFGEVILSSGDRAFVNPLRFSSEYSDDALGLVYYNYRHYKPMTGRWMNRDPINEIYSKIMEGTNSAMKNNCDCSQYMK